MSLERYGLRMLGGSDSLTDKQREDAISDNIRRQTDANNALAEALRMAARACQHVLTQEQIQSLRDYDHKRAIYWNQFSELIEGSK